MQLHLIAFFMQLSLKFWYSEPLLGILFQQQTVNGATYSWTSSSWTYGLSGWEGYWKVEELRVIMQWPCSKGTRKLECHTLQLCAAKHCSSTTLNCTIAHNFQNRIQRRKLHKRAQCHTKYNTQNHRQITVRTLTPIHMDLNLIKVCICTFLKMILVLYFYILYFTF